MSASTQAHQGGLWSDLLWGFGLVIAFIGYNGFKDIYGWLRRWHQRPWFSIEVPSPPYIICTEAMTGTSDVRWYYLVVQNHGRTDAVNCQVRVMSVLPSGVIGQQFTFAPVVLHWAHEPRVDLQQALLVRKRETRKVDIFTHSPCQPDHIKLFRMKTEPDGIVDAFPPGKYEFHIRVTADNAETLDSWFTVRHHGKWNEATEIFESKRES